MKPAPFAYEVPESLPVALTLLAQNGDEAKILAGGQSLIPAMNFRLARPSLLVDLNHIHDLNYVRRNPEGDLLIGAMTRQSTVEHEPLVGEHAPLLAETLPFIAHPQIRNRGTIGGSLAHADPASELPVIAVTRDYRFRLRRQGSERWVEAADFFQSLFTTALEPEEILVEIAVPPMPERTGYAFQEVARRQGDYALAGVAALVTVDAAGVCTAARLVGLNVGDIPVPFATAAQSLVGEVYSEELARAAAHTAGQEEAAPTADIHATEDFKRHLVDVLTRRTVQTAFARAAGNGA